MQYARCGNNNYGVHDVGRQGLMRTAITRHMPSATRQRREGKKNVDAAGLGCGDVCIIKPSPADPAPALGFLCSMLRNVRC